jgi:hypothetical protein
MHAKLLRVRNAAVCGITTCLACASILHVCLAILFIAPASAENVKTDTTIIIEKNLFSPDRKKWISEAPADKKSAEKLAKKEINDLMLMGTAIRGKERYAVLHAKKDTAQAGLRPWMKGDYVQGYLLKEIEEKMVVLQDEADNKEYILYINDEKKERVAEKTDVKPEQSKVVVEDMRTAPPVSRRRARKAARPPANPVEAPDAGRQAMQRSTDGGGGVISPSSSGSPDSPAKPFEGNDTR